MSFSTTITDDSTPTRTTSTTRDARDCLAPLTLILVSGALSMSGTSSADPNRLWEAPYVRHLDVTVGGTAGAGPVTDTEANSSEGTRRAISQLRRISGLTWEQLGQLFEVSRRSVHFWASGKALNASNETRLMRVLDVISAADRGHAHRTRAALFEVDDGVSAFELLTRQRFDEARARLGAGVGRRAPTLEKLSDEAKAARAPLAPNELIDARHDRVHRDPGHARAARTVRNNRRGNT